MPVSYTHLDVYKRQGWSRCLRMLLSETVRAVIVFDGVCALSNGWVGFLLGLNELLGRC